MLVYPLGTMSPVAPVTPVAKVTAKKTKAAGKATGLAQAATLQARPAENFASHSTRAALDEMKLGG